MTGKSPLIWPTLVGKRPGGQPYECDRCRKPMTGRAAMRVFVNFYDGMTVQWELCSLCEESLTWWKGPIGPEGAL